MEYQYQRERRHFGKQYQFKDKNELLFTIASDRDLNREYILRDPVSHSTQYSTAMALSEINTERATFESHGINHTEGGWPKDISQLDPEQTTRYRRKIEKDELYISQVMNLTKPMEHCIYQNNAINIYETFFEDLEPAPLIDPCTSRTVNVYRDPSIHNNNNNNNNNKRKSRPISHLSWSPDGGTKLAISYCDRIFQSDKSDLSNDSYIWEIENPNTPLLTFTPPSPLICLEYNQKDPTSLISGMYSGQLAAWDTRADRYPVAVSEREVCHREPVNSVSWINSKSGTEFFSGSADGQVIWWDTRKLNEPLERLFMDPIKTDEQILSRSYGVSILEYETTMPTKFMCGTDMGMVFCCNRKGKTPLEKITTRMMCHLGPVYTITRNPSFLKNFLTIGDWTARIWSEDCRESSIIWTKHQPAMLTDGVWSPTKCSMFYVSRMDGVLDAWDLLQQQNEPVLSIKVCDESLLCMRAHEGGKLISAGSESGATFLIEVSDNMSCSLKNDKPLLTAMFERENKREKILEAKLREIKLKVKTAQIVNDDNEESRMAKVSATAAACAQAEQEYIKGVKKEKQKMFPKLYKHKRKKNKKGIVIKDGEDNVVASAGALAQIDTAEGVTAAAATGGSKINNNNGMVNNVADGDGDDGLDGDDDDDDEEEDDERSLVSE